MITPYLLFEGNCSEALAFYQQVFDCQPAMVMPYSDYDPEGAAAPPADLPGWVLHAEMSILGTNFWFADEVGEVPPGRKVRLTATVPTRDKAQTLFDRLKEGAEITLPPVVTFYSAFHAALTDRFGVMWDIVAEQAPPEDAQLDFAG